MTRDIMGSAKGDDGAEELSQQMELRNVRTICMREVRNAVAACPKILGPADIKIYENEVISDHALAISGITNAADKIRKIREVAFKYIPELIAKSRVLETKFRSQVEKAHREKWISKQSADRWMKRLHDPTVHYYKKKRFIEEDLKKFPAYLENWKRVAEARKKLLSSPLSKSLRSSDVGQMATFLDQKKFLNLSFEARESLVSTVTAALTAKERQIPQLYAKAKAMLEGAARTQALSWSKVGTWLERIFKSGAKAEQIEKFLNNEGNMPLQKLIENWSDASKHFQTIEAKRKSLGTPRSFHFVSMNVFLSWGYEQRQAYLREAEHRFIDINREPEIFLKIRHELDTKDWDGAEELIEQAKKEDWGAENRKKLKSLETFLKRHRTREAQHAGKDHPNPAALMTEMRELLSALPPSLRQMYEDALADGYQSFWSFTVLMYNRVWCHQHGFYDEDREQVMEQEAKDPTRKRMREGHDRRTHEVNVVKDDTDSREAIRDQSGINRAQIMFVNLAESGSRESVREQNRRQCRNRNWWYWTSIIPEGVKYGEQLYIVQNLHPRMKKIAKKMHQLGMHYSPGTTVPSSLHSAASTKGAAETSYAMAA